MSTLAELITELKSIREAIQSIESRVAESIENIEALDESFCNTTQGSRTPAIDVATDFMNTTCEEVKEAHRVLRRSQVLITQYVSSHESQNRAAEKPQERHQANGQRVKNPVGPAESPIWGTLTPHKGKIKTNGKKSKEREYYKWDYAHNDIEVFDSKGIHIGSVDPTTGDVYKPRVRGRRITEGGDF